MPPPQGEDFVALECGEDARLSLDRSNCKTRNS